jgi:hypothetical protein
MTPEQKAAHLDNIIYSDGFDELVAYRLKMSLEGSIEDLEKWSKVKDLESDYRFEDYVDNLKYCRSLVTVLEAFTMDDYTATIVQLNKYSLRLEEMF